MTQMKLIGGDIVIFEGKEPGVVIGRSIQDGVSVMVASRKDSPLGRFNSYESIDPSDKVYTLGEVDKDISREEYEHIRNGDHGLTLMYY